MCGCLSHWRPQTEARVPAGKWNEPAGDQRPEYRPEEAQESLNPENQVSTHMVSISRSLLQNPRLFWYWIGRRPIQYQNNRESPLPKGRGRGGGLLIRNSFID